ncbi:hypothetical protein RGU12_20480 [Fredinandcohnia sp. QZ13]|uniref:hypothetical protein n=1 Tax=Fredinandcohnia sp. QZ13 TaxID=3073144 RepID=UPI00285305C2|nr:hypothetical protein [Fredinandcohnia sp. QZ13]MDR4889875.1 hypothetical protein [Fredinandcohnia sp. QZ13]
MTVLFGTVEYFEKEIVDQMSTEQLQNLTISNSLEFAYSSVKNEIMNVFICSDIFRKDLLVNIEKAYEKVRGSMVGVD